MRRNGNGNGQHEQPQEPQGVIPDLVSGLNTVNDQAKLGLLGTYMVRIRPNATLQELLEFARTSEMKCLIETDDMERALDGLKRKDVVSINRAKKGGQSVKTYSIKKLNWRSPPATVEVSELIHQLESTTELRDIKNWFEAKQSGDRIRVRGNDIDDYWRYRVTAITLSPLLGSQIKSPYAQAIKEAHPSAADELYDEVDGMFERDQLTGAYIISPDILQGWLVTNGMRIAGLPEARAQYVCFEPVFIHPNAPVYTCLKDGKLVHQYVLPVNSSKTGPSAPKAYEAIPAGQELVIRFSAPTKGFVHPKQLERIFHEAGLRPRRGISPARGRRFGRFLVVNFESLGPVKDAGSLDDLYASVPQDLMQKYAGYLTQARQYLSSVNLYPPKGGALDVVDESPFPSGSSDAPDDTED